MLAVLVRAIGLYILINAVLGFITVVIAVILANNVNAVVGLIGPLVQVIIGFTVLNRADAIAAWAYR
ncbi:MAG TPA: hypothetical protein VMT54_16070 [Candidatus Cybelea sp.]|nr:hypothetical protein [Candidatus Cybelea sp.]